MIEYPEDRNEAEIRASRVQHTLHASHQGGGIAMPTLEAVIQSLKEAADPEKRVGMAQYGMAVDKRLGASIPDIRGIAKRTGKDHALAQALWATGIAEARILASMVGEPDALTEAQIEMWVQDIDSWDICDQVCMNLFEKTPMAWEKIEEWSLREEEFVKRAAYALLACLAWHDKGAEDRAFLRLLPTIEAGAGDERNFVKKAVSWALRNIGKRNVALREAALKTAEKLGGRQSRSARWIAAQTVKDLNSEATLRRLRKQGA
jgi:3-methyladenine DNA glycosylase AlkD